MQSCDHGRRQSGVNGAGCQVKMQSSDRTGDVSDIILRTGCNFFESAIPSKGH